MFRQYKLKNYNFKLIIFVVALSIIGYFAIGSAKLSVQESQLNGIIVGCVLLVVFSFIDYSIYHYFFWIIYIFNTVLLTAVLLFGTKINGSKRWLIIGFQFQPSELAKILLILFFAEFIMKYKERLNTPKILIFSIILVAAPIVLIYKEPDLSTSIMIVVTFCVMMFIGGLSYKIVIGVLCAIIPLGIAFFSIILQPEQHILEGYQITRILAWLQPEKYADSAAYQQLNSITAIGSGQLWGKGLNNNVIASVKNGNFISEPQTDFIYAVIGEELGFAGACAVIVLLILIVLECLKIAKNAKDLAGTLIANGVAAVICLQGFMNIAVTTGLLPNTGIPLPFVSYGRTSLMSLYIGIGVVLNVGLQAKKYKKTGDTL